MSVISTLTSGLRGRVTSPPHARGIGVLLVATALLIGASACGSDDPESSDEPLRAGSFNFDEGRTLSWIYALALEANGVPVDTSAISPGSTREILAPALEDGEIDFVPEYIGSFLNFAGGEATADASQTYGAAREHLAAQGVTLLPFAPAQNTNSFVISRELSERLGATRLSDLTPYARDLVFGATPECPRRALCAIGLQDVYGIRFGQFEPLDLNGRVARLEAGQIDVALLFSTDAIIATHDWVVLEDDQSLQPAENISLAIRTPALDRDDVGVEAIVAAVSERLTTEELRDLNRQVQIERLPAEDAARRWLEAQGLAAAADSQ
jgi:osmoprotectant transport system substrate-binding protein